MNNISFTPKNILKRGKKTLLQEADALKILADSLGDEFIEAVKILYETKGRIVITGIGKSGHIARKIAATLSSTGAPSLFVHSSEASHGDLGMIVKEDVIIAISNSGQTHELNDIMSYSDLRNIPLIAITKDGKSPLAQAASLVLKLPDIEEACSMGLAPTTSTTMTLALGDAIAIALLEAKGFTESDFRNFHPGGKLGSLLLRAVDVMHTKGDVPLVPKNMLMREAIIAMASKRFGCIGVIDGDNNFCGLITDGDLRRTMQDDFLNKSCGEVMTINPYTVGKETMLTTIVKTMTEKRFGVCFVLEGKKPIGIIHIHDILRAGVV